MLWIRGRRLLAWLWLFGDCWATISGVALIWAIIWALGIREQTVRIGGLALQVLGILTVFIGISKTKQLFGRPTFVATLRERVRLLRAYMTLGVQSGTITAGGIKLGGHARGYQRSTPSDGADTIQRLDSLERNIGYLNERIDGTLNELDEATRNITANLEHDRSTRMEVDAKIASRLENLGVGGLTLSGIGAIWLLVGTIMATIPAEITAALR